MKKDIVGPILLFLLFILLTVTGFISYKSIDWTVLNRLENQSLTLPTQISTTTATSSAENLK